MDSKNVQKKVMTLVYIRNEDKVLLGMKKRGFGEGKCHFTVCSVKKDTTF